MMEVLKLLSAFLLLSLLPPGLSHVVKKFSDEKKCKEFFLDGETPSIHGILVKGVVEDQNRYKPICQHYKNSYRFATLYDMKNRIPVFSAYTYTGSDGNEANDEPLKIEPQLNGEKDKSMAVDDYENQADNKDYYDPTVSKLVKNLPLFSSVFASDDNTKRSSFTMTNIVPQAATMDDNIWSTIVKNVKDVLDTCLDDHGNIKAYVVTGAMPSVNPVDNLNNRVNVPSHMWTAYCCYNATAKKWVSNAHWVEKKDEESLPHLHAKLITFYNGDVKVFPQEQCVTGTKKTSPSFWERIGRDAM